MYIHSPDKLELLSIKLTDLYGGFNLFTDEQGLNIWFLDRTKAEFAADYLLVQGLYNVQLKEVDDKFLIIASFYVPEEDTNEAKKIIKVNSKGQRTRKLKCDKGKKLKDGKCVTQSATEKLNMKRGKRKAVRTKKSKSQRQAKILTKKAKKKRKQQGL